MYYLIIKTTVGRLDLGALGVHYQTRKEAEKMADLAKTLPDALAVWIVKK